MEKCVSLKLTYSGNLPAFFFLSLFLSAFLFLSSFFLSLLFLSVIHIWYYVLFSDRYLISHSICLHLKSCCSSLHLVFEWKRLLCTIMIAMAMYYGYCNTHLQHYIIGCGAKLINQVKSIIVSCNK